MEYDLKSRIVSVIKEDDMANESSAGNKIPEDVITFGYEDALKQLQNNDDYKKYKSIYPAVFEKYTGGIVKDSVYGWEWKISYVGEGTARAIQFAMSSKKDKAVTLKTNMD